MLSARRNWDCPGKPWSMGALLCLGATFPARRPNSLLLSLRKDRIQSWGSPQLYTQKYHHQIILKFKSKYSFHLMLFPERADSAVSLCGYRASEFSCPHFGAYLTGSFQKWIQTKMYWGWKWAARTRVLEPDEAVVTIKWYYVLSLDSQGRNKKCARLVLLMSPFSSAKCPPLPSYLSDSPSFFSSSSFFSNYHSSSSHLALYFLISRKICSYILRPNSSDWITTLCILFPKIFMH